MKRERLPRICFWLGVIVLVVAVVLPDDTIQSTGWLYNLLGELKPVGLATIFILPVIGSVGVVSSLVAKSVMYGVLNSTLILSFPLMMLAANIVQVLLS